MKKSSVVRSSTHLFLKAETRAWTNDTMIPISKTSEETDKTGNPESSYISQATVDKTITPKETFLLLHKRKSAAESNNKDIQNG